MVLHHIEKLQPALKEMTRVLKPGGALLIVDYAPKASHELEFQTRNDEGDFFKPALVTGGIRKFGLAGRSRDFGVWYMVEAKKPAARPLHAPRAARARPRAG